MDWICAGESVFGSSSSVVDEEVSLSSDVRLGDVEEDMLVV
jgi:hypothetical protein